VGGFENIAIAEHRHAAVHVLHEAGDLAPVGVAGITLRGGASVQGDGGGTLVGSDASGVEVGAVLVVDADTHLHGDGNVRPLRGFNGGGDDVAEEAPLVGQGRATATAGHFGHGAAEVHIDVVSHVLIDDHLGCFVGVIRIGGVQLQAGGGFVRREGGRVGGFGDALHGCEGGDRIESVYARDGAQ